MAHVKAADCTRMCPHLLERFVAVHGREQEQADAPHLVSDDTRMRFRGCVHTRNAILVRHDELDVLHRPPETACPLRKFDVATLEGPFHFALAFGPVSCGETVEFPE
eukprot:2101090-Rhodomonas_salina.1